MNEKDILLCLVITGIFFGLTVDGIYKVQDSRTILFHLCLEKLYL